MGFISSIMSHIPLLPVQNDQSTSLLSHTLLHTGLAISISPLSLSLRLRFGPSMGFPFGYPELPRLLIHLLFLLLHLRRLINLVFHSLGLSSLLGSEAQWNDSDIHSYHHQTSLYSLPAKLIQESLPVVQFEDLLAAHRGRHCFPESCAVCLYKLEGADEVRLMSNCRHVFHRRCVDRWLDHGQCTCPMCRAPFFPEEVGISDASFSYDEDRHYINY